MPTSLSYLPVWDLFKTNFLKPNWTQIFMPSVAETLPYNSPSIEQDKLYFKQFTRRIFFANMFPYLN